MFGKFVTFGSKKSFPLWRNLKMTPKSTRNPTIITPWSSLTYLNLFLFTRNWMSFDENPILPQHQLELSQPHLDKLVRISSKSWRNLLEIFNILLIFTNFNTTTTIFQIFTANAYLIILKKFCLLFILFQKWFEFNFQECWKCQKVENVCGCPLDVTTDFILNFSPTNE